jgi:hypothetical protein
MIKPNGNGSNKKLGIAATATRQVVGASASKRQDDGGEEGLAFS